VVTVVNGTPTSSTSTGRSTSTHLVYVTAAGDSVASPVVAASNSAASSAAAGGIAANANSTSAASRLEMSAMVAIMAVVVGGIMLM
jgi:hypothetical protein